MMNKTIQKYFFIMLAAVLLPATAFAQTTVTFTNAAATGNTGPTQSQVTAAYDGTTLDDAVTINTQGIQEWTVPATGTYTIEVWGAQGGNGQNTTHTGGQGARMKGDFTLSAGDVLKILVGQQGSTSTYKAGGGGGGTYVVKKTGSGATDITALIIAGGGSGGGGNNNPGNGQPGLTGTSGGNSTQGGFTGGSNGSGGNTYSTVLVAVEA